MLSVWLHNPINDDTSDWGVHACLCVRDKVGESVMCLNFACFLLLLFFVVKLRTWRANALPSSLPPFSPVSHVQHTYTVVLCGHSLTLTPGLYKRCGSAGLPWHYICRGFRCSELSPLLLCISHYQLEARLSLHLSILSCYVYNGVRSCFETRAMWVHFCRLLKRLLLRLMGGNSL